jgi:NADPH:quinone reductase-like Zn-dependent oxidoreductase
MKAVVLSAYGDVDKLQVRDVPNPHAGPDSIVVRVAGASINPIDWKMRSGAARSRFPVDFPGILGRDVSGEVVEVGEGVKTFARGDRVLGFVNGSYAELVSAPVDRWVRLPERLDLVDAGALPLVLLTGAQLIEEAVRPKSGDTVLVIGGVGMVGRVAVYAAKELGAKVWVGIRPDQRGEAAKLGVEGAVVTDDPADIAKLPTLDAIADTVDGDVTPRFYAKLKPGGVIGSTVGEPAGAKEHGFVVRAFVARPHPAMLARYANAVAEGKLTIPIAMKLPLARAPEAQAIAEKQHPAGKVLLVA